jgi:hypothetical protein
MVARIAPCYPDGQQGAMQKITMVNFDVIFPVYQCSAPIM